MKDHTVADGDCLSSIAFENGFFWQTLWDHPSNADLKKTRKDPFALAPGDVVHIPDLETKSFVRATGAAHVWKRKGVPARLKVQLKKPDGSPRADEPYEIAVDGKTLPGDHKTDGDGKIEHFISPDAIEAVIRLDGGKEEHHLRLGHIHPIDQLVGVQERLANLGFYTGSLDGELNEDTQAALEDFQAAYGIDPSGELDDATREKLRAAYGG